MVRRTVALLVARWRAWRLAVLVRRAQRFGCVVIDRDAYRELAAELAALQHYTLVSGHLSRVYNAGCVLRKGLSNAREALSRGLV